MRNDPAATSKYLDRVTLGNILYRRAVQARYDARRHDVARSDCAPRSVKQSLEISGSEPLRSRTAGTWRMLRRTAARPKAVPVRSNAV